MGKGQSNRKFKVLLMKVVLLCFMLFSVESIWAGGDNLATHRFPERVAIYRYEKFSLLPSAAQVVIRNKEEHVIGEAEVSTIRWDRHAEATELQHFMVEETHFGEGGQIIYRVRSKFNARGQKVAEEVIEGKKQLDLFPWWPVEPLP
jgi:ATP-dependent Zn protease